MVEYYSDPTILISFHLDVWFMIPIEFMKDLAHVFNTIIWRIRYRVKIVFTFYSCF